jgi:ABC-2 type transport system permease protein
MKIYRRKRTWILAAILLVLIIGMAVLEQRLEPEVGADQWQQKAQQQIKDDQKDLKDLKDAPNSVKSIYTDEIARLQYSLEHHINPYEKNNWYFTNEATQLLFVVTLFVVIIASDIVSGEFTWGSIKMLMVRPHRRWSILLSKYLASILTTIFFCLELMILSWIVGGFVFGFGDFDFADYDVGAGGEIVKQVASVNALQTYGLEFLGTIMVMTIAFMLSTLFRSGGLAIGISIVVYYAGGIVGNLLSRYDWGKYVIFNNIDLSYYLSHPEGMMKGMSLSFSLVVDLIYWLVFMIVTWWIFQKRDITT